MGYLETFNDGNYSIPTFLWSNFPSGQWSIVNFAGSPASQFNHQGQVGTSYPSDGWVSPSNNYFIEGRVYIQRTGATGSVTSYAAIGGRCTTGGIGYFVQIEIEPSINPPAGRTRVILMSNNTALHTTSYSGSLLFDQWVTLRLEMIGNNISYYFNGQLLGTVSNFSHGSGRPFLRAFNGSTNRLVYFDDIRIEFRP